MSTTAAALPRRAPGRALVPLSLLLAVLLPLLLMPLAAIYVFAARGGLQGFIDALREPDAQFALRFSVVVALVTAAIN